MSTFVVTGAFSRSIWIGIAWKEGRKEGKDRPALDRTARKWMDGIGICIWWLGTVLVWAVFVNLGSSFRLQFLGRRCYVTERNECIGLGISATRSINVMTFQIIQFGNSDNQKRHPGIKLQIQRDSPFLHIMKCLSQA
jgi:hypothetical protein